MRWPSHTEEYPRLVEGEDSLEWIYDNVPAYEKGLEKPLFPTMHSMEFIKNEVKIGNKVLELQSL